MDIKITPAVEEASMHVNAEQYTSAKNHNCATDVNVITSKHLLDSHVNMSTDQSEAPVSSEEKVMHTNEVAFQTFTEQISVNTEACVNPAVPNDNSSNAEECEEPKIPTLPLPDPISDFRGHISAFGFSQQGESHIKKSTPCQDRSSLRFLSDTVLIAAIADGVGSCALSDYGADTAVNASLDFLQKHLGPMVEDPAFSLDVKLMGRLLREMMQYSYDQVQMKADDIEQLLYSMQSTLTVAVYDGKTLYFAHAGDDGIVALVKQGKCEMVTSRHKGEEASSVYPLQSRNTWQYGMVEDVVGFIMATDGVLDAFVRNESEGNRIYYPFIEPAFFTPLTNAEDTAEACKDWFAYMKTPNYRASVTDDLSFISAVNQEALKTSAKPVFDIELWKQKTQEYEARRRAALYPPKEQQKDPKNQASGRPHSVHVSTSEQNTTQTPHHAPKNTEVPPQAPKNLQTPPRAPKKPQAPPVARNMPYYLDKDTLNALRECGLKAATGLGGMLVIGSEMLADVAGDVILRMKDYVYEVKDFVYDVKDTRNCPRQSANPSHPKCRTDNGDGGSNGGK